MSDMAAPFSVRAALGLWLTVLTRRPGAFMSVALVTVSYYAALTCLIAHSYSVMGQAFLDSAEGNLAARMDLQRAGLMATAYTLLSFPIWLWLETVWIRLFNNEKHPWRMRWAEFGCLIVANLILFGIYMVGVIVWMILGMIVVLVAIAGMAGGAMADDIAFGAAMAVFASTSVLMIPVLIFLAKFSALPALAVMRRRVDMSGAWRATKGALWRTAAAWVIAFGVYLGALFGLGFAGQLWPGMLRAYGEMMVMPVFGAVTMETAVYYPYTAFAGLFDGPGAAFLVAVESVLMSIVIVGGAALMRGIGVTLAWRAPEPDEAKAQGAAA